jgi:hypothetical protein
MQHNNNIENKLREMEAMEQPDLSQVDAHWQQMAGMLQPSVLPVKKGWSRWMLNGFYGAVVAVLIGGAVLYFSSQKNDIVSSTTPAKEATVPFSGMAASKSDTITNTVTAFVSNKVAIISLAKPAAYHTPAVISFGQNATVNVDEQTTLNTNITAANDMKPDSIAVLNMLDRRIISVAETNAVKMNNFFGALKKPAQYFEIDTQKDTTLIAENGTSLFIPAKIFVANDSTVIKGIVTLQLKEYYNYQEIVGNKLHTTSNGQQLVSGGMVHLSATQNGKKITVAPAKEIILKMPVNKPFDDEMQLFTAQQQSTGEHVDTASDINWQPAGQSQRLGRSKFRIKIFDPSGQPYKTFETKNGKKVARFVIRDNCKMTNKEVLKALTERYGMFYDKITVRRSLSDEPRALFSKTPYPVVGDSIEIDLAGAIKMKMLSEKEIEKYQVLLMKDSIAWSNKLNSIPFYEFRISQLGYFNCDRFGSAGTRTDFTIKLNDSEGVQNLYAVLAFEKYRSVLYGYHGLNQLRFLNVPKGEKVHVICVGVKDGTIVSSIQPFTIGEQESDLKFIETNPVQFSEQLKELHLK